MRKTEAAINQRRKPRRSRKVGDQDRKGVCRKGKQGVPMPRTAKGRAFRGGRKILEDYGIYLLRSKVSKRRAAQEKGGIVRKERDIIKK